PSQVSVPVPPPPPPPPPLTPAPSGQMLDTAAARPAPAPETPATSGDAVWTTADDDALISVLEEGAREGKQSGGGWKVSWFSRETLRIRR
ncbi:hypothetical protein OC834_005319, partial [Tilletia horrida]